MHLRIGSRQSGMTLVEVLVTAVMVAIFFSGVFEVSAVCLRYIASSKESINAIETVQDRIEQLRGTDFTSLLDPTYMSVAPSTPAASPSPSPQQRRNLTVPPNASTLAQQGIETVKISTYTGGAATTPYVTYTRAAGARYNATTNFSDTNVTPSVAWSSGSSFPASTTTVQVDVTYTWTARFGQRSRSETSSTILSAGTKK